MIDVQFIMLATCVYILLRNKGTKWSSHALEKIEAHNVPCLVYMVLGHFGLMLSGTDSIIGWTVSK
jgi:hypothetical protein